MEDRELIADIIYSFCWLASDDRDDALDLADRIIEAGYIRQPEPSVDNELACGKENNRRNPNTN